MGLLVVPGSSASKNERHTLHGRWYLAFICRATNVARSIGSRQLFHVSKPPPRIFLGTLCKTQDTLFIVFGRIWNNGRWVDSGRKIENKIVK